MFGLNHMITMMTTIVRLHLTIRSYDSTAWRIFTLGTSILNSLTNNSFSVIQCNKQDSFSQYCFSISVTWQEQKEPLISQKKEKNTQKYLFKYRKEETFQLKEKSSKKMDTKGLLSQSHFCLSASKSRTDCCRMLNTGALPKTNMALQHSLFTWRKIKQLNSIQYLHNWAQCIIDISSISFCQIDTSPCRKLTAAWSVTGQEFLFLELVLNWSWHQKVPSQRLPD